MRVARQASRTRVRPAGKRRLYAALCAKASPLLPKAEANAFPSLRDAARTERYANAERLVEKGEDRAGSPKHRGTRGPLWGLGAGRQSVALAGWGDSGLISNQADMI